MNSTELKNEKSQTRQIVIISIIIPVAVAFLIFAPWKIENAGEWTEYLPHLNGVINSITAVLLIAAVVSIKKGNKSLHKSLMLSAFTLGAIFLVSYILYHASTDSTIFGDSNGNGVLEQSEKEEVGSARVFYLILLLAHILLATIVVPLVLFALYFALKEKFDKHKKIVKFTFPIWLFVSISGVVVYLLISPYY